jgi:HAD superfamily hydrolase (TIGR01549 family)
MAIRAVLFDLGNTLWHIPAPPPAQEIREETMRRIYALLRSWGIEPEGDLRFLGRDIRLAITAADRLAYETDGVSPHFPSVVSEVAKAKGLDLSAEQVHQLWQTWNLEGSFFGRRLFDDAIETLAALREQGLRLACVTNRAYSGPQFMSEVEALGLAPLFEVMSVSCDLGYMKPHPNIFLHAIEALDVAPDEVVMVGDSLRADVAGAQALGMTAVWRRYHATHSEDGDGIEPHFVVDELRELLELPIFGV